MKNLSITDPSEAILVHLNPSMLRLPVYSGKVAAGQSRWASAAQDYDDDDEGSLGGRVDLNTHLVTNPPATFLMPVTGDSMTEVGIYPGTILIVDKSVKAKSGSIVVAWVESQYLVKQLYMRGKVVELRSKHPDPTKYPPIRFKEGEELIIWGVVTRGVNNY